MNADSVLVFDMDGVLAEVSESYLAAVAATVQELTGVAVERSKIDRYKEAGGWNNDWELSHQLVKEAGRGDVSYETVLGVFQKLFIGTNCDGMITREKWLPQPGLLERLSRTHRLAIFTGRPRAEIEITLQRFAPGVEWAAIVADEDVARPKPAPDGLEAIAVAHGSARTIYVGDNVDDARSAHAAGVRFIGVATTEQERLAKLLRAEGAIAVVPSVNEIESVL